jgi:hypothetical protein
VTSAIFRNAAVGASLLFVLGCRDPTGTCSWENRSVAVSGRDNEAGTEVATGQANLFAMRGSQVWVELQWSIVAPSLAGHVTSIALVSRTQSFPDVELPFDGPAWSSYHASWSRYEGHLINPNSDLDGLFEPMAANLAAFRITTDLPAQPVIMVWLSPTHSLDWFRPTCGG